jgi:fructose-specific phosphotransferase system IIA component
MLIEHSFIKFQESVKSPDEAIRILANTFALENRLSDTEKYINAVKERESEMSTAIGYSIATPHAKTSYCIEPALGFMKLEQPLQWGTELVQFVFLIAVPEKDAGELHLKILAQLSRNIINHRFRRELEYLKTPEQTLQLLKLEV